MAEKNIHPKNDLLSEFAKDLLWIRQQLEKKSFLLIGLNNKVFRIKAWEILLEIWQEGVKKNILKSNDIVKATFEDHNHIFHSSFPCKKFNFDCKLTVHLKKSAGKWSAKTH